MNSLKINTAHKTLSLLTAIILLIPLLPNNPTAAQSESVKGDANKDGVTDVFDLVSYKRGEIYSPIPENMDLNYTGTLTKTDVIYLKKSLLSEFSLTDKKALVINEICSSNNSIVKDAYGNYSDWIELYNGTSTNINLSGYGLSDNPNKPFKWVFPDGVTIGAGQYLIVFASELESVGTELHASFAISKNGEPIVLTKPDETTVDLIDLPAVDDNITFGRFPNGSDILKALSPSYGKSNDIAKVVNNGAAVAEPKFSNESGFYDSPFNLSIDVGNGEKLFYTTDGSDPTISSPQFTGSVNIKDRSGDPNFYSAIEGVASSNEFLPSVTVDKGTIIRVLAYEPEDGNYSNTFTKSYFVGSELSAKYGDAAIISIVTDPDNLFDYEKGIFVKGKIFDDWVKNGGDPNGDEPWFFPGNYSQKGRDWEREVHMEFFEGGTLGFSEQLGMRISGNASRSQNQKSLKFYARSEYGSKNIKYDLLPGLTTNSDSITPLEKFDTFILRSGANDADYAKIRDSYVQDLVSGRSFDTQGYRPAVAFVNGEYWGVYSLIQDYNDKYVENHYGVPADEAIIIKNGWEVDDGVESDVQLFRQLISYAQNNDLSVKTNYETISQMMDIDSYIEYYCAEIYVNNWDWPQNNYRVWRSRTINTSNPYMDGRWRWMMFDTDLSLGIYTEGKTGLDASYDIDSLYKAMNSTVSWAGDEHYVLFRKLMQNSEFKQKFVITMMDMVNYEFNPDYALKKLDDMVNLYAPLMPDNIDRYGPEWVHTWWNPPVNHFYSEIDIMKSFLNNRYPYMELSMKNNLSLGNTVNVTLSADTNSGTIIINSISPDLSAGVWTGKYFTDYPVTVKAIPKPGYEFKGWSGGLSGNSSIATVNLTGNITITANFNEIQS